MAGVAECCSNWHIAAACHIICFLVYGMMRISGLIFAASLTRFGVDREHASLPFVSSNIVKAFASLLSGYLGHTLGLRPVIIAGCFLCSLGVGTCFAAENIHTLSIYWSIYGLGCGLATSIIPQVLNEYFVKHKTKANGFAIAGAPLAGFVMPPVVVALLKEYGVSGTFLILSAILLHSIPAAMLLKKPDFRTPRTKQVNAIEVTGTKRNWNIDKISKQRSVKKKDSCLEIFSVFWDPIYLLIAVPKCVLLFVYNTVPMFLVDFFSDKGFSVEQSTYLLMHFAAFDFLGKLCLGFITDSNYMSRTKFAALLYTVLAVSFVLMVFSNGFVMMIFALAVEALCTGGIRPLHPGLVAEYLDTGKQTMAIASSEILLLPLSASSVSLIGHFRDDLGSYDGLLYILAAIGVTSTAVLMGLPNFSNWWTKRKNAFPTQSSQMIS